MLFEEAKNLTIGETVWINGLYDSTGEPAHCKVTGQVKLWKTRPEEIKVPVKKGLKDCAYIHEENLNMFTLQRPESIPKSEVKTRNAKFKGV